MKADWAFTNVEWAKALAIVGKCQDANARRSEYQKWLPAVVFLNDLDTIKKSEGELDKYIANCHEGQVTPTPREPKP